MTERKVLLVYPEFPLSYWGMQYSLPLFGKKAMHPPLSLITVAALFPQTWKYKLVDMNVDGGLSDESIAWADMVFISGMGIQAPSLVEVAQRCRALGKKVVVGGPCASGSPNRFAEVADYQILDEGEITIPLFLADLEAGCPKALYQTDKKPDVSGSPIPRFDLLRIDKYSLMDIQFSRGCPFNCEFCDIIALYGRVPRTKTPDQILGEMQALYDLNYRGPIFLVDDNFIGNKKAVKKLLEAMIPWMEARQYPFFLTTEASINLGEDRPLLDLMRRAGFKRVFLGIETPSMESLKETQKYQNTHKDMITSVHDIIENGMEVTAGFIVGFDNDTPDIFQRQIEFIEKSEIPWAMVGTLTAIPATQLWARLEKEGRILGLSKGGDQFGRPNFQTKMDPDVLFNGYLSILENLYAPEAYFRRVFKVLARQDNAHLPNLHENNYPALKVLFLSLMTSVRLGILAPYRRHWWAFMAKVSWTHPKKFVQALINSVIGHHFIKYTAEIMQRERMRKPADLNVISVDIRREPARPAVDPLPVIPPTQPTADPGQRAAV